MTIAQGSQHFIGVQREVIQGVLVLPLTIRWFRPFLPNEYFSQRPEELPGTPTPEGFAGKRMAAPIVSEPTYAFYLNVADVLPFAEHFYKLGTKTPRDNASVQDYLFTMTIGSGSNSLTALMGIPGHEKRYFLGQVTDEIEADITPAAGIVFKLKNKSINESLLSVNIPDGGNTGTYPDGPVIRGILTDRNSGDVYVDITDDEAGAGIKYKVCQSIGTPLFLGAEITLEKTAAGLSKWTFLTGTREIRGTVTVTIATKIVTGVGTHFKTDLAGMIGKAITIDGESHILDSITSNTVAGIFANHAAGAAAVPLYINNVSLGSLGENFDPVEIYFPGDFTTPGTVDTADQYKFEYSWTDPVPTYSNKTRFSGYHLTIQYREYGSEENYITLIPESFNFSDKYEWTRTGLLNRRPVGFDPDTLPEMMVKWTNKYGGEGNYFRDAMEQHRRLDIILKLEADFIGENNLYRESFILSYPRVVITDYKRPVAAITGPIIEEIETAFDFDANAPSAVPTLQIITTEDFNLNLT